MVVEKENEVNIEQIMPNFSFEEEDEEYLEISMASNGADEIEINIDTIEKKPKNKYTWVNEAVYDNLELALEHIEDQGFILHNDFLLKCGQKFHFRCQCVPASRRPRCDRKYILYLPSDRVEYMVQHNNMPHNCHEIMKGVKKRLSEAMKEYMFEEYMEKETLKWQTILAHVTAEKNKGNFPNDDLPKKRQIEHLLNQFAKQKVKPLFKLGELMDWCKSHSVFPNEDDEVFALGHECSSLDEKMKFRFVLSTPELLSKAIDLETICIDAT